MNSTARAARLLLLLAVMLGLPSAASAQNNVPPIADANGPYQGFVGEPILLDGTGSSDLDGRIVQYAWDFGDGTEGEGPTPTHVYANPGLYDIVLVVTDDAQATDSTDGIVQIDVREPDFIERDDFDQTWSEIQLLHPGGTSETVVLRGPATVAVTFDGPKEGDADDGDQNGTEEVPIELIALSLQGDSSIGPIKLALNPQQRSVGSMEEQQNTTKGVLDVPPFAAAGFVDSFFDVFVTVETDQFVLFNEKAFRLTSVNAHKPPAEGEAFSGDEIVQLFAGPNEPTGFAIGPVTHVPNPKPDEPDAIEVDVFDDTTALLQLVGGPLGNLPVPFILRGGSEAHVFFEGPKEGDAQDDDGDGLDEVGTELVEMDLSDGLVSLRVRPAASSPFASSRGEIEEETNFSAGLLDLPPFNEGTATSFFDVFFEIELEDGSILHNGTPLRVQSRIHHKPPRTRYLHIFPVGAAGIELLDENDDPTGILLTRASHHTGHVEIDRFEETSATLELISPAGASRLIQLRGPSVAHVFFEGGEGAASDDDGDGLDEVATELVSLQLVGGTPDGPATLTLNPDIRSLGEIEELENFSAGLLDLPPFNEGQARSFFDVFFRLEVDGLVFFNAEPKRLSAIIDHKPPAEGNTYESPERIELLDANGEPTGYAIGPARHTPRPRPDVVEIDVLDRTTALLQLVGGPLGAVERSFVLRGDSEAHVFFEGPAEGDAFDDDGDGFDEVQTELVALSLTDGLMELRLNAIRPSLGEIEERSNDTPGTLDVSPFAPGTANSFFDVFFEIELEGGVVLHNERELRIEAVIHHKPPNTRYIHLVPPLGGLELFDANNQPTGIFLTKAVHHTGEVEIDRFEDTSAVVELISPLGGSELIRLRGPSTAHVFFEGGEGDADDDDGDGLEEVETELVSLDLSGPSSLGLVRLSLNPNVRSNGALEETANDVPGTLDVPPFTATGTANSFFDVFFQIEVDGEILVNHKPKRLSSLIRHKPPADGDTYESPTTIPLFDLNGEPTGWSVGAARHVPNPRPEDDVVEIDFYEQTTALVQLQGGVLGDMPRALVLRGPSEAHVFFEGPVEGVANDDDGDGLDEVNSQLVSLDLTNAAARLTLNAAVPSRGQIEETANVEVGLLDLPPFQASGRAISYFDVFFELELEEGGIVHNREALRVESLIYHKPPHSRYIHLVPPDGGLELFDANGEPTGIRLTKAVHHTGTVEIDQFEQTSAQIELVIPGAGSELIALSGPSEAHVFFEGSLEGDAFDDDGDGLDEVDTELVRLQLSGQSPTLGAVLVTLNSSRSSIGAIEERLNGAPGILDVQPFTATGTADSFFDVFVEVQVQGMRLHNREPKRLSSVIDHKPPGPGEVYESPTTIPLFDDNGEPSGFALGAARHIPNPRPDGVVEIDTWENTTALMQLVGGAMGTVPRSFVLRGPSEAHVFFEGPVEGDAFDDDGDGLDEVGTQLVEIDLTDGGLMLRLNPAQVSMGEIEEQLNGNSGLLDVPPFAAGLADSFFDVFFEVELGDGTLLHNREGLRIEAVIDHKPPRTRYIHLVPPGGGIELYDENDEPTGIRLVKALHHTGHVEIDDFERTRAEVELLLPTGGSEIIALMGPSRAHVFFEGDEGDADDDDGDGLDEVDTELVSLDLRGTSALGIVQMTLNPDVASAGEMEERTNATPGLLDVSPFAASGLVDSFFDVYFVIDVGGRLLHNRVPKHMASVISEKPPAQGEGYENPQTIPLFDENGEPSGFAIGAASHVPRPGDDVVEIDAFESTTAVIELAGGVLGNEAVPFVLRGPSEAHVFFEGPREGDAYDDDGNGLDEVSTELVALSLSGGDVSLTLNNAMHSFGQIEERDDAIPGTLEVPPFAAGVADSFFDVFFEVKIAGEGLTLRNEEPLRVQALIRHKPPYQRYYHLVPPDGGIELVDENGQPTGIRLVKALHHTGYIEEDSFENTRAVIELVSDGGASEVIDLVGPSLAHVYFERREGEAVDDDGDGLDEVESELVRFDLRGESAAFGPVRVQLNPRIASQGEIEENVNATPGILDVAPFSEGGSADSFFDVFVEVEVEGEIFHNLEPKRMSTRITHKPPGPGATYESPTTIPLYTANGDPSGLSIGATRHTPNQGEDVIERDVFESTTAVLELRGGPLGPLPVPFILRGPSTAHVFFEGPNEGDAEDDDGDGLDEVDTELVSLNLNDGAVFLSLNPSAPSLGEIEERQNDTPGTLDVAPFVAPGPLADSFFDVFFEVTSADVGTLHNREALRMVSVIRHKPPRRSYIHLIPPDRPIMLYDENDEPSGIELVRAAHHTGFVEIDHFDGTNAAIDLASPSGATEHIQLRGPTTVHVFFEGPEGAAEDDDGNGRDDVLTRMTRFDLVGQSVTGAVKVRLNPELPTTGLIEERVNATPGLLDLPPFANDGSADSFFDVFFEVELEDGTVMHNREPKRLRSVISHKPPGESEYYESPVTIELYDANGQPTGYRISAARHIPRPPPPECGNQVIDFGEECDGTPHCDDECQHICPGPLPGDANGDGVVNGGDYTSWADHYLHVNVGFAGGDFNCNGLTDGGDYTIWADHFGEALLDGVIPPTGGSGAEAPAGAAGR